MGCLLKCIQLLLKLFLSLALILSLLICLFLSLRVYYVELEADLAGVPQGKLCFSLMVKQLK